MSDSLNELMNKYLDGGLKGKELQDFEELIKAEENKKIFNVYSVLDKSLRKAPADVLPSNFTASIMQRIQSTAKAKNQDKKFFFTIVSVFGLMTLLLLGFLISQLFNNNVSGSSTMASEAVNYMKEGVEYLQYFFPKKSIPILGGFISFGVLLTAWFFLDFRNKKI